MVLSELTKRYRIFYEDMQGHLPALLKDREMYQELRGNAGSRLYVHGEEELAISCESERTFQRLLREIPRAKMKTACVMLFRVDHLSMAAESMNARKRRQATDADRERGRLLAEKYGFRRQTP